MSPALGCERGLPPPPSVKKLGRKENLNSLVWPEVEYFCFLMDKIKAIPRNAPARSSPCAGSAAWEGGKGRERIPAASPAPGDVGGVVIHPEEQKSRSRKAWEWEGIPCRLERWVGI